jgi:hypothetical protein
MQRALRHRATEETESRRVARGRVRCGAEREERKFREKSEPKSSGRRRLLSGPAPVVLSRGASESVAMLTPHNRLMFHDFYYAGIEMEVERRATTNDTLWRETFVRSEPRHSKRLNSSLAVIITQLFSSSSCAASISFNNSFALCAERSRQKSPRRQTSSSPARQRKVIFSLFFSFRSRHSLSLHPSTCLRPFDAFIVSLLPAAGLQRRNLD